MGTTSLKWISGKQFIGIDSTNHSVVLSTPDEGVGIKPSELLLIAVASCTAVDIVEILAKKRMPLNHLDILCSGEQDPNPPWTFRKIHLRYIVGGKDLTEKLLLKRSSFRRKSIARSPQQCAQQPKSQQSLRSWKKSCSPWHSLKLQEGENLFSYLPVSVLNNEDSIPR